MSLGNNFNSKLAEIRSVALKNNLLQLDILKMNFLQMLKVT